MFDLADLPVLDKATLIGTCARLRLAIDAPRLRAEVQALPVELWGDSGGRVGVHRAAAAIFLRGHAPAEGDMPIEDRPVLARLPYAQQLIGETLGDAPLRCLLARLPAGASIAPHVDRAAYFHKTVRIHVPVETHAGVWMVCGELCFSMQPGEAWALNNSTRHAVWNAHASLARTHLICDYRPSERVLALLASAERELGRRVPEVDAHFAAAAAGASTSAPPGAGERG